MPAITSLSNQLVKHARALRNRKARAESGLFLVEGIHPVGAAVEAGWEVEVILHAPELLASEFASDLLARGQGARTRIQPVSAKVMESLAEKENPQGILALVRQRHMRLAELPRFQRGVALVSPQDPGNVGAILRTMDAVGADVLFLLDGGVDAFHPTAVRASTGSLFWKTVVETRYTDLLSMARASEYHLIGTTSHGERDRARGAARLPWIVLFGSEQKGLSDEQVNDCDLTISLPMRGHAHSLNLAVAAGVVLYHLTGQ